MRKSGELSWNQAPFRELNVSVNCGKSALACHIDTQVMRLD